MKTLEHTKLYGGYDKTEVYDSLQRDFNRDTKIHLYWQLVLIGAAIGAAVFAEHGDWLWIFIGIFAAERAISIYVDNSNRNWAMHIIDFLEANRRDDDA